MGSVRAGLSCGGRERRHSDTGRLDFDTASGLVQEAIALLGRDAIVIGHGLGGLIALALAERPHVRAAIALAPALPASLAAAAAAATLFALLRRRPLAPPRGRVLATSSPMRKLFNGGPHRRAGGGRGRIALQCARGRIRWRALARRRRG